MDLLKASKYKPGQKCPISGIYQPIKSDGTTAGKKRTVVKGEPFPPLELPGLFYKLFMETNEQQ